MFTYPVTFFKTEAGGSSNGLLNDLVLYYKMDSDATDAHGSNDGTATNVTRDTSDKVLGTAGADLNGTSSRITTSYNTPNTAYSINLWLRSDVLDANRYVIDNNTSTSNRTYFYYNHSLNQLRLASGGKYLFSIESFRSKVTLGSRHMITVVFKSGGNSVYVDGSLDNTSTTTRSNQGVGLTIGSRVGSSEYYNGGVDGFGLWSKELTTGNISDLYNSGSGLDYDSFTT